MHALAGTCTVDMFALLWQCGMLYYHKTMCTADTPPLVSEVKEHVKVEAIT